MVVTGAGGGSGAVMFTIRITASSSTTTAPATTSHRADARPEIRYQSLERGGLGPGILFNRTECCHEPSTRCRYALAGPEGVASAELLL